jgi:hypothetical protein
MSDILFHSLTSEENRKVSPLDLQEMQRSHVRAVRMAEVTYKWTANMQ